MRDIKNRYPDRTIETWFQDEARVGQHGRLTRIWGEKGKRIRLLKDMEFESTYIFGAICPERDTGEAIVLNRVSKKAMQKHIDTVSDRIPSKHHAVMIMDNAPWHKGLKLPDNITIIYLPPYSPELNAHENIWEYLKNAYLSNRVFKSFDHLTDACCEAWNRLIGEAGRIRSVGMREWAYIN